MYFVQSYVEFDYQEETLHIVEDLAYNTYGPVNLILDLKQDILKEIYLGLLWDTSANPYDSIALDLGYKIYNSVETTNNLSWTKYEFLQNTNSFTWDITNTFSILQTNLLWDVKERIKIVLDLGYQLNRSTYRHLEVLNTLTDRTGRYLTMSYPNELPVYPTYLDGNLAFYDNLQLPYLESPKECAKPVEQEENIKIQKLRYDFRDVLTTSLVASHGPAYVKYLNGSVYVNNQMLDITKQYQVIDNVQILKVTDKYYVYSIAESFELGEFIILDTGEYPYNNVHLIEAKNLEYDFVTFFPVNRLFDLSSLDGTYFSGSKLSDTVETIYPSSIIPSDCLVVAVPGAGGIGTLQPVSEVFRVLKGGENVYFDGTAFYLGNENPQLIVSFNNAANGVYDTEVTLIASYEDTGIYKLNGINIDVVSTTIIYSPSAMINKMVPTIIKKKREIPTIYTTDNFNTIAIDRTEYKLSGRIQINTVDYWAKLTWQSVGVYHIDEYSLIADLNKLATLQLIVVKSFNKFA